MRMILNGREMFLSGPVLHKRLVEFLRNDMHLTGAKNACDIGVCGACTVLINDEPQKICQKFVGDLDGARVLTIEGMAAEDGALHPLQQAFIQAGAIQCGFCTPGMVLTAHAFLLKHPHPTRADIRRAIYGNICRCTGYQQIVDAIEAASVHYRDHAELVAHGKP